MTREVTKCGYSCGHVETIGGSISDPQGFNCKLIRVIKSSKACSVCSNPYHILHDEFTTFAAKRRQAMKEAKNILKDEPV